MAELTQLLAQINALPADQSPYLFVSDLIRNQLAAPRPDHFWISYGICSGLYALTTIFSVASILGKIIIGGFWLFKTKATSRGKLLVPNATLFFSFFILIFSGLAQVQIYSERSVFLHRGDMRPWQNIIGPFWCSIFIALWFEVHSQAASAFIGGPSFHNRILSRLPAWLVNVVCLLIPIAFTITATAMFARISLEFGYGYKAWLSLDGALAEANGNWQPGARFAFDPAWLKDISTMQTHLTTYRAWSQDTYISMTVFVVLILALFVPLSVGHALMLRQQMKDAERLRRASSIRSAVDKQFRLLKRMYSTLLGETICCVIVCTTYTAVLVCFATNFESITSNSNTAASFGLVSVWVYAVIGPIVGGLIAYRTLRPTLGQAWRRWRRSRDSQLRSVDIASGIHVVTEVVAHVDHENIADLVQLLKSSAARPRFAVAMVDHEEEERPRTMELDSFSPIGEDEEKPRPRSLLVEQVRLPPVSVKRES